MPVRLTSSVNANETRRWVCGAVCRWAWAAETAVTAATTVATRMRVLFKICALRYRRGQNTIKCQALEMAWPTTGTDAHCAPAFGQLRFQGHRNEVAWFGVPPLGGSFLLANE